jgi:spermidine synthase
MRRGCRFWFALAVLAALAGAGRAEERVLYEQPSQYNRIVVTEDEGLRILRFERGGARQTAIRPGDPEHLELRYSQVVFVGLALSLEHERFLVVGLGGGALPSFLRRHYPKADIDAVEIDPAVVDVAKRYFSFREDARMHAYARDGRDFVEAARVPYDVIFLDAFGPDAVPPRLATVEFLRAVRRAVKPGGVVVGNLWGPGFNPQYGAMIRTYQEVFDELYVLDVAGAGNKILLALPRREPLTRAELAALARKVSAAKGFRFDMGGLVESGFSQPRGKAPEERVLRDP